MFEISLFYKNMSTLSALSKVFKQFLNIQCLSCTYTANRKQTGPNRILGLSAHRILDPPRQKQIDEESSPSPSSLVRAVASPRPAKLLRNLSHRRAAAAGGEGNEINDLPWLVVVLFVGYQDLDFPRLRDTLIGMGNKMLTFLI